MNRMVLMFLMGFALQLAVWVRTPPQSRGDWMPLVIAVVFALQALMYFDWPRKPPTA